MPRRLKYGTGFCSIVVLVDVSAVGGGRAGAAVCIQATVLIKHAEEHWNVTGSAVGLLHRTLQKSTYRTVIF